MSSTYALSNTDLLVTDGASSTLWLRDLPQNPRHWHTEALVASGDYCEMLASTLEQVACALPESSVEQYQVQDIIGQLIYIQRRYKFVKKQP